MFETSTKSAGRSFSVGCQRFCHTGHRVNITTGSRLSAYTAAERDRCEEERGCGLKKKFEPHSSEGWEFPGSGYQHGCSGESSLMDCW